MWGRMTLARPGPLTMPDFSMTARVCNDSGPAHQAFVFTRRRCASRTFVRLTLRRLESADAATLCGWHGDDAFRRAYAGADWGDRRRAECWIRRRGQVVTAHDWVVHAAGSVGLASLIVAGDVGWLSYAIDAGQRGRGLGTVAVRALVTAAPPLRELRAVVADANQPSRRLLQRLGFTPHSWNGGALLYALAR
jgi:RimJ/RimL family protein N-acetyltransferase